MARIELKFEPVKIVNARSHPSLSFEVEGELKTEVDVCVFSLWTDVRCDGMQHIVQSTRAIEAPARLNAGVPGLIRIPVDLTPAILRSIHERSPKGPTFTFGMRGVASRLVALADHRMSTAVPTVATINENVGDRATLPVSREQWLELLKNLKYDEIEVFELRARAFKEHELLRVSLDHVRRAEGHFRSGNWAETLASCSDAFEATASVAGAGDKNLARGFDKLWEQVFPRQQDEPKRPIVNAMVKGARDFFQLGRHSREPFVCVSDHDALLALRLTLSFFEYTSLQLGARSSDSGRF